MYPKTKMILKRTGLSTMIVMSVLVIPQTVLGLRCDHRVISVGDTDERVLRFCGPPDYQEQHRIGTRIGSYRYPTSRRDTSRSYGEVRGYAGIERWTYDFGANRLVHHLDFMNGRLTDIRTEYQGG
jgi:hypothetical protein